VSVCWQAGAVRLGLDGQDSLCEWQWRAAESGAEEGPDTPAHSPTAPGASAGRGSPFGANTSASLRAHFDGRAWHATVVAYAGRWHVFVEDRHDIFTAHGAAGTFNADADDAGLDNGAVLAPMPGKVIALLVEPGSQVERDTPLLILEAMKMEHAVCAPRAGLVQDFRVGVGDSVAMGELLVDFSATPRPA